MKKLVLLGFLLLLSIDTASSVLIKLAGNRIGAFELGGEWLARLGREPLILAVIGCYMAAFVVYTTLLKYAPVGPAYAAVHGYVVSVLVVSMLFLGERLTWLQALGSLMIVAGIIVLAATETLEPGSEEEALPPEKPGAGG